MKMSFTYVLATVLLIVASFAYRRYNETQERTEHEDIVRRYLVRSPTLAQSKKPFLWIHSECEPPAYRLMAIKSIADHCGDEFNICVLNDSSFAKVLPGWQIDMSNVADPLKGKLRRMGLVKLLREYGGLVVPDSFVCARSLLPLLSDDDGKTIRDAVVRGTTPALFLGAPAQHEDIIAYATRLEQTISSDYTAESVFHGDEEAPPANIPEMLLGLTDSSGRAVGLERLMGSTFVELNSNVYGLYILEERLSRSTKYEWFRRLSAQEVLHSNTFLGKRLLLANGR